MDGARNMNKYDTMLAVNKKRNKRKIDTAKKEIYKMLENGEKVTVTKLIEQTGLSTGTAVPCRQYSRRSPSGGKDHRLSGSSASGFYSGRNRGRVCRR